jgi:hypothetical protein
MTIKDQKQKMLEYKDFFGGQLLDYEEIEKAKSKLALAKIIDAHYDHIENMCNDAQHSLERFKKEIKLTMFDY